MRTLVILGLLLAACNDGGDDGGGGVGNMPQGGSGASQGGDADASTSGAGGGGAGGSGAAGGSGVGGIASGGIGGEVALDGGDDGAIPDGGDGGAIDEPYAVGTERIELMVSASRTLPVQLWYPAVESARAEAEAGRPASELEPAGERRTQLDELLSEAPEGCANERVHAADAPEPIDAVALPLVLISHCYTGARLGYSSLAEELARQGFLVAAADHEGGTLYDELAGMPGAIDLAVLEQRYGDLDKLLATLLDDGAENVPSGLRGRVDPARLAIVGHSLGSITAGIFSFRKPEIKASVFIAAPPEVPLFASPTVLAELTAPALFFYASEDNSIPTILNDDIKNNYRDYPKQAWLVELADAGHFAFSDLCGTHPALMPGCGEAARQTNPFERVTYLEPAIVREATARYTRAFLERVLLGGPGTELDSASPAAVTLSHHD